MSLLILCVICISKKNILKTKQGNQKLKDNLLCYFKCSFKLDKPDFRVQFSFKWSSLVPLKNDAHGHMERHLIRLLAN